MADEQLFSHKTSEIELESQLYGSAPPQELDQSRPEKAPDVVDGVSGDLMYEYYREGTIDDVPVPEEWQNLLLKDGELDTVFRDEHHIESVCFVHIPENNGTEVDKELHQDYEDLLKKYQTLVRAVSLGVGYVMSESNTYDASRGGYVVRLVVSLKRKTVRPAFRGTMQKIPADTLKKLKVQGIPNAEKS